METYKDSPTSFPLRKLTIEVREAIWSSFIALEGEDSDRKYFQLRRDVPREYACGLKCFPPYEGWKFFHYRLPYSFLICHESRVVALRTYKHLFRNTLQANPYIHPSSIVTLLPARYFADENQYVSVEDDILVQSIKDDWEPELNWIYRKALLLALREPMEILTNLCGLKIIALDMDALFFSMVYSHHPTPTKLPMHQFSWQAISYGHDDFDDNETPKLARIFNAEGVETPRLITEDDTLPSYIFELVDIWDLEEEITEITSELPLQRLVFLDRGRGECMDEYFSTCLHGICRHWTPGTARALISTLHTSIKIDVHSLTSPGVVDRCDGWALLWHNAELDVPAEDQLGPAFMDGRYVKT